MTLLELLAAMTIVSILVGAAYLSYDSVLPSARLGRATHDLGTIADALATYDRDHPGHAYMRHDLAGLQGRYLDSVPQDPWQQHDFIVDPFFKRVISTGPDGLLQTVVLGQLDNVSHDARVGGEDDDLSRSYGAIGFISFIEGGVLKMMRPDGTAVSRIYTGLTDGDWASMAPDRTQFLISKSGALWVVPVGSSGASTATRQLTFVGATVTGGKEASWAPTGKAFSFIADPSGAVAVGVVVAGNNVVEDPIIVATGVSGAHNPRLSPGGQDVVFQDGSDVVLLASATEGSPVTTLTVAADGSPAPVKGRSCLSPDGKRLYYTSNDNSVWARDLRGTRALTIARIASLEIAVSPSGHAVASVEANNSIRLAPTEPTWPTSGFPATVYQGTAAISSIDWK